jgi:hypothetical protein
MATTRRDVENRLKQAPRWARKPEIPDGLPSDTYRLMIAMYDAGEVAGREDERYENDD